MLVNTAPIIARKSIEVHKIALKFLNTNFITPITPKNNTIAKRQKISVPILFLLLVCIQYNQCERGCQDHHSNPLDFGPQHNREQLLWWRMLTKRTPFLPHCIFNVTCLTNLSRLPPRIIYDFVAIFNIIPSLLNKGNSAIVILWL